MFEPQLHLSSRRKPAHFAVSAAAHVLLAVALAQIRVEAPLAVPPAPPRAATRITLAPLPLPPPPKPRSTPLRATTPPPIERVRAVAPQPQINKASRALAAPEAPRLEIAPTPIAAIPRPDEVRPPLAKPPRLEVRTAPVFDQARAEPTSRELQVESSARPMFSSAKPQAAARLNLPSGDASAVGFGAARVESASAKASLGETAPGGFSSASGWTAGPADAPAETVQAGFAAAVVHREKAGPVKAALAPQEEFIPVRILAKPEPVYTAEARALRLEGDVAVEALFTADGRIVETRVVRGLGHGLDEAAVAAVQAIVFEPARRAGAPVEARLRLTVRFQIAY